MLSCFDDIAMQPGATTRKGAFQVDRQNSDMSYYADDEDGNKKKYSRRGAVDVDHINYPFCFLCFALFGLVKPFTI